MLFLNLFYISNSVKFFSSERFHESFCIEFELMNSLGFKFVFLSIDRNNIFRNAISKKSGYEWIDKNRTYISNWIILLMKNQIKR
jgi:hypothetical protein